MTARIMIAIAMKGSIQGSFPQTASIYQNPPFSIITLTLSEKRIAVNHLHPVRVPARTVRRARTTG
jgi:hypothetical protein